MQQAILQVCTINHNMVGEHEPALECPPGDAAIQHLTLLAVVGQLTGDHQRIVLDDHVQFIRTESRNRHGQAVGVLAGLLDVVGRIAWRLGGGSGCIHQASQPIEADGGTEQRSEVERCHGG